MKAEKSERATNFHAPILDWVCCYNVELIGFKGDSQTTFDRVSQSRHQRIITWRSLRFCFLLRTNQFNKADSVKQVESRWPTHLNAGSTHSIDKLYVGHCHTDLTSANDATNAPRARLHSFTVYQVPTVLSALATMLAPTVLLVGLLHRQWSLAHNDHDAVGVGEHH